MHITLTPGKRWLTLVIGIMLVIIVLCSGVAQAQNTTVTVITFPTQSPVDAIDTDLEVVGGSPDFGTPVFWIKFWNIPSFIDDGDGNLENDEQTGIAHDGDILINPQRNAEQVFFEYTDDHRLAGKHLYYKRSQMVTDPRETNWWLSFALEPFEFTLWEAVGRATLASAEYAGREHTAIIKTVIDHMVAHELVSTDEFTSMSNERVKEVLWAYTELYTGPLARD
jgi:hypothetical protein